MNIPGGKVPEQDAGASDFVDPSPPQSKRLARKNVTALALGHILAERGS